MLTPQEQETPGTALGSRRPSRDMSPYEEPDYGSSSYAVRGILFALLRWPHWLTALEGIRACPRSRWRLSGGRVHFTPPFPEARPSFFPRPLPASTDLGSP